MSVKERPPTKREIKEAGIIEHDAYDASSRSVPVALPSSMTESTSSKRGTRHEIHHPAGARAFFVEDILSVEECQETILRLDAVGWKENDDIVSEYPPDYRNNQRLIILDKKFAWNLFLRLMPHFREKELLGVKPMGWGAEGIWKPCGINNCILFTRYGQGQFFRPHFDGHYKNENNQISIYSITLYLNDVPEESGGNLIFYQGTRAKPLEIRRWRPKRGWAVIFQHDLLHAGEEIKTAGTFKYIARTSVMFERVSDLSSKPCLDPRFLKMKNIFANFDYFRASQDPEMFTKKFLEAQELQLEGGRTFWEMENQPFMVNDDVIMNTFSKFLGIQSLCQISQVCKNWFLIFRKGSLWRQIYIDAFGLIGAAIVNPLQMPDEAVDWYGAFKARAILSHDMFPVICHSSNLQWTWWKDSRPYGEDKCRVEYKYDGWDAGIQNWTILGESYRMCDFWWGGDWNPKMESGMGEECLYECWLSSSGNDLKARLQKKMAPEDPDFLNKKNFVYPQLMPSLNEYDMTTVIVIDVIWPHWFCKPDSKNSKPLKNSEKLDWTLVSEYSRGLEYVEEILPNLIAQKNPAAITLLEAGLAGMCATNLSTGSILCISLHGVLVVYTYKDTKISGDPHVLPILNWKSLVDDYRVRHFILKWNPQIIMCDIGFNPEDEDQEYSRYKIIDDYDTDSGLVLRTIRFFYKFVQNVVLPKWAEIFNSSGKKNPKFVSQQDMMFGAEAFAQTYAHVANSFVYVSSKLGGMLQDKHSTVEKFKEFYLSSKIKMHTKGMMCPYLEWNGHCPRDPCLCPWQHSLNSKKKTN